MKTVGLAGVWSATCLTPLCSQEEWSTCVGSEDASDDFEDLEPGSFVTGWNIYSGQWTPIAVAVFTIGEWLELEISVDTVSGVYDLKMNGSWIVSDAAIAEALTFADRPFPSRFRVPTVERIEFRTGACRMSDFSRYGLGDNGCLKGDGDLPGADEAVMKPVFDIDYFRSSGFRM